MYYSHYYRGNRAHVCVAVVGDFAVLLRAGMSVKQAVVYNCVSSVLCLVGMVIGVCVGNIGSVSLWIFSLTAGIFIYIALVDMVTLYSFSHESMLMQPVQPLSYAGSLCTRRIVTLMFSIMVLILIFLKIKFLIFLYIS